MLNFLLNLNDQGSGHGIYGFSGEHEIARDKDRDMNHSDLDTGRTCRDSMIKMIDSVTAHGINHLQKNAMVTVVKGFDHHHNED
jgi:hypothetical protein